LPNHVIEIKSTSRSKPQIVHTNRVCLFNHLEDVIANSEDKIQEVEQQDIPAREDESKQVHFTDDDDNDDDDDKDYHNEDDINDVNPIQPVQLQQPQPDTNSLNQTPTASTITTNSSKRFTGSGAFWTTTSLKRSSTATRAAKTTPGVQKVHT